MAYYRFVAYQWPWNRILALSMTSPTNMTVFFFPPVACPPMARVSCIFSHRVKLKELWEGTPWWVGVEGGGGVYGVLSEGCLGSNCINMFSRLRRWQLKLLFRPIIFSSFPWSREPGTDSPKPVMQNRWRFVSVGGTHSGFLLLVFVLLGRQQPDGDYDPHHISLFDLPSNRCAGFGFLPAH